MVNQRNQIQTSLNKKGNLGFYNGKVQGGNLLQVWLDPGAHMRLCLQALLPSVSQFPILLCRLYSHMGLHMWGQSGIALASCCQQILYLFPNNYSKSLRADSHWLGRWCILVGQA